MRSQTPKACRISLKHKLHAHYAAGKQIMQEQCKAHKHWSKRDSPLRLYVISLSDVLPTKQNEPFLRSFNMTATTGGSVWFVLRGHDSVLELAISPQADLH